MIPIIKCRIGRHHAIYLMYHSDDVPCDDSSEITNLANNATY